MTGFKNVLVCSVIVLTGGVASAFTASDADTIFNSYNNAFYVSSGGNAYYKLDTGSGTGPGWWTFAEEIEMAEDSYDRTGSSATRNLVTALCNAFIAQNGKLWTYDSYNDDITWAVIAFARAYQATGNTNFQGVAKSNFDAMYSRAWDTTFTGGGLWWSTADASKNACINGPAAVAACYLYNIYGDSSYLSKAQACYAWERGVLFNTNSGAIDDNIATNYVYNTWASTYNQGTFIGAGNFLYRATGLPFYYQDAILAAKYTQNSLSSAGILPVYSSGDLGGFNGIFARWMARMAKDQNLWFAYGPWLNTNANAAWNVRNTNNLSWYNWTAPTPAGTNVLDSWDCSDTVVIMQVALTNASDALLITPGIGFTAVSQQSLPPNPTSVTLVLTNTGAISLNWSLANTSVWLTVSANTGTLAVGGPATNVQVSLIPSATTNLPTGRYYTSVWLTNLTSGVVQSLPFTLVVSGGNAPIAMTGYNAGVLAPNSAAAGTPNATAFDIPNSYCFYQVGLNGSTRGLPPNGVFTSQLDATTVFQFLPYGNTNALVVGYGYSSSATLTLTTPQAYISIAILACSANGTTNGGVGTFVLNFTDETHSQAFNFNAQDWWVNSSTNVAIQGMGRLKLGSSFGAEDDGANNPNLYQTTLNLAGLGLNQTIASITFTKPANAGSQQSCGVFAVSGMVMPTPAIPSLVWVGATANSTLDGNWNTSDLNWLNGVTYVAYVDSDLVRFDDSATGTTNVTLAGTLLPGGITVSNTAGISTETYTFAGSGSINSGSLLKQGSGTLIVDNSTANAFSGLIISGGTLQVGDNDAKGSLGSGSITDISSLVFSRNDSLTITNVISGSGTVTDNGTGILNLSGANTFAGPVTVAAGTLQVGNTNALGPVTTVVVVTNGGTLDVGGPSLAENVNPLMGAKPIYISGWGVNSNGCVISGPRYQINAFQNLILAGNAAIGGNGNRWDIRGGTPVLSTGGKPYNLYKVGSSYVAFVGVTVDTNLANIDIKNGVLAIQQASSSLGNPASNLTVEAGAILELYNSTTKLASYTKQFVLNGDGVTTSILNDNGMTTLNGNMTLNGNCVISTGGTAVTNNAPMIGSGGLIKSGAAVLVLTTNETYTGNTTVSAGTLSLVGTASIVNSTNLTVQTGATINVSGRVNGLLTLHNQKLAGNGTIGGSLGNAAGSVVSPGTNGVIGILTVTTNVWLNGMTVMKLDKNNLTNDVLSVGGNIVYGGTLNLTNISVSALSASDSFTLFRAGTYGGAFTSIVPAIPALNLAWNTNGLTNGVLSIVFAPTPPPNFSGVAASGNNFIYKGTNGVPDWTYYVLASTNLTLPISQWTVIATNTFDGDGNCNFTNLGVLKMPQTFYLLKLQ